MKWCVIYPSHNHSTRISAKPFKLEMYTKWWRLCCNVLLEEFKGNRAPLLSKFCFQQLWSFLIVFDRILFFYHSCPEQFPWENFNYSKLNFFACCFLYRDINKSWSQHFQHLAHLCMLLFIALICATSLGMQNNFETL